MLQTIAAWVLQNYLGEYIENLNADQLSIGYGGIELENLFLKRSALQNLRLPVKLISGVIGHLKLVIPYRNPNTQPWIIQIEELNLVAEYDSKAKFEDDKEKLELFKRKKLSELEAEWRASVADQNKGGWWSQSWFPSLYSSFSTKIVENLQLKIKDVNIRYSIQEKCSFGVSIGSLIAQSANKNWEKSTQESSPDRKYKVVELSDLTVYCDDKNIVYDADELKHQITNRILGPINAEARINRNGSKTSLQVPDGPRFYINVFLQDLALTVVDSQYKVLVGIVEDFSRYFKSLEHKKWKPQVPVHQNAKSWWTYAIQSVMEPIKEHNKRCRHQFIMDRLKDVILYVQEYREYLSMPDGNLVKDMTVLEEIESKMTYEEIAILRRVVYSQLKESSVVAKMKKGDSFDKTEPNKTWTQWAMSFGPYWSSGTENQPKDDPQADLTMTKEEKEFLEELTESYMIEEESVMKRDAILAQLSFTLQTGSLILKSETKNKEILNIKLDKVDYSLEVRPKTQSYEWVATLGSLMFKNLSPYSEVYPVLVQPQKQVSDVTKQSFLRISFGKKKGHRKSSSNTLDVTLQPSNVVYDAVIFNEVKDFFTIQEHSKYKLPTTSSMSQRFKKAVNSRLEELKLATKVELNNVVDRLTKGYAQEEDEWVIHLNIAAPQIIIPLQHCANVEAHLMNKMMIFNLGRIVFHNDHAKVSNTVNDEDDDDEFLTPSSTPPQEREETTVMFDKTLPEEVIREMFYDRYKLELNSLQISVTNHTDDWNLYQVKGFGPDHVVDQFSVSFDFKRRTVFTADPDYPALLLSGVLPQLLIHIDEVKLQVIYSCLSIITNSVSNETDSLLINEDATQKDIASNLGNSFSDNVMLTKNIQELLVESKLLLAKFTFEKLSLGLHSRGRCFAELQVNGVECELTKRPFDLSVYFVVSSLLLVDAIQMFGPEYELLVSSKEVSNKPDGDMSADDFLIHIHYQMINADCPTLSSHENRPVHNLTINFNTLYINGNLETIVELHSIINQLTHMKSSTSKYRSVSSNEKTLDLKKTVEGQKITIKATFKTIEVLLLRTVTKNLLKLPLKVSKISCGNLELEAAMDKHLSVKGIIGTIAVLDLSPTALSHNTIFSVGSNSIVDTSNLDVTQALTFTYSGDNEQERKHISVRMASAYYLHHPLFIQELNLCAGDFKLYAINLAKSLQMAATDMAKSIVTGGKSVSVSKEQVSISADTFNQNDIEGSKLFYTAIIQTPVILLPKDEHGCDLVVGYLGKITLKNEFVTEAVREVQEYSGKSCNIDRLMLDFEKVNLSVVNLSLADLRTFKAKNYNFSQILTNDNCQQIPILHNTNLHIRADKCTPISVMMSTASEKQYIHLECSINSPLKLFLSVPIYKQILTTLSFVTKTTDSKQISTPLPSQEIQSEKENSQLWENTTISDMSHSNDEINVSGTDVTANFTLPSLQIDLQGELHGKTHGFVTVLFEKFQINYSNLVQPFTIFKMQLQNFVIEDLLHERKDKYKYLVSSSTPESVTFFSLDRACSSYPEEGDLLNIQKLTKSLPNILNMQENEYLGMSSSSIPSLTEGDNQLHIGPLISLEVTLADKDFDDVSEQQKRRNINIDVNGLDVVINLQTWVILLDFFGIGAQNPVLSPNNSVENLSYIQMQKDFSKPEETQSQTDLNINMKSLILYMNKETYPLAEASLSMLSLNIVLADGNQDIDGSIGNIKLVDLSPSGSLYRERLISLGEKAFSFTFFRFGVADADLAREYDMDLNLSMSAIQYVHTQRFLMEVISFCQHFLLLQEVLGRMRAVSAGNEVQAVVNRAARLCLKVHSESPILILPRSFSCNDLLVANLGTLNIENKFLYCSDPKTNGCQFHANRSSTSTTEECLLDDDVGHSTDRLLDCISVKLTDMKIFSALRIDDEKRFKYEEQGDTMMSEPCKLDLTIERNLEWMFGRQVPDMSITGTLSSVHLILDLSQFSLIMGMLGENLGEQLDTFIAPSSVLVDPLVMSSPSKQVWTTMHFEICLSNVSIEAVPRFSFGDIPTSHQAPLKLAKFDFLQSKLLYESFSDGSKSIDLVSTDVLLHDIRSEKHLGILLPSTKCKSIKKILQFEVHYLDTKERCHLTLLCNQSKVLLTFNFLLETFRFILRKEENEYRASNMSYGKEDKVLSQQLDYNKSPTVLTKATALTTTSNASLAPKKTFEIKVNATETELVVIDDIHDPDTRTVILKTTAVVAYRPDHSSEKPLSCSLQSLEVFSCIWSQPDESALSIVDPVAFLVELNSSQPKQYHTKPGLLNAVQTKPFLEIQFQAPVNVRLSYHDVQMFIQIIESTKMQLSEAMNKNKAQASPNTGSPTKNFPSPGPSSSNTPTTTKYNMSSESEDSQTLSVISGIELKSNVICVTLINDAGNNDVPLLDVIFGKIMLRHDLAHYWKGFAKCHLDVNYYNIRVSAWEPFIESWRFNIHWFKYANLKEPEKLTVKIDAPERLDLNFTSALMDITKQTTNLWFVDTSKKKKRAPFLPFLFRNETGSKLGFHTIIKSPTKVLTKLKMNESRTADYYEVQNKEEVNFSFEERSKQRHQMSHNLLVHQVVVQVSGFREMKPLTVDRVGEFFRVAYPVGNHRQREEVYVILEISLEGARKVVTAKSALMIQNCLTLPIELMGRLNDQQYSLGTLDVQAQYIVPLYLVRSTLYCRPLKENVSFDFCNDELNWKEVSNRGEKGFLLRCQSKSTSTFSFCALIQCIGLPKPLGPDENVVVQPEHIITLQHHISLKNGLPFDLFYILRGDAKKEMVKPGGEVPVHTELTSGSLEIGFSFENFPSFDMIKITNDGTSYSLPARIYDTTHRLLILNVVVDCRCGTLQISVFAPYWLINKTGLPIMLKREDDAAEVAGQFDEHEEARSLLPLPFSYVSSEYSFHLQMRLGRKYQPNQGLTPLWCKPFSLEKDTQNRTLYLKQGRDRPGKSYDVGIVMNWGKGLFSRTRIVSFVPRFQLDNQTVRLVAIAQRYLVDDQTNQVPADAVICFPGTVTNFHWSRADLDRIVYARLGDDDSMLWSGGFRLDFETVYHLNIKSTKRSNDFLLRVHITFIGGTYRCTLSDAASFPPPYRIINTSDVGVFYWQENVTAAQMRTVVKAKEARDYVLDEPLLPPYLVLSVYQESAQTYFLKHDGTHLNKLYYQNAIFISFSHTFYHHSCSKHDSTQNTDHQLVLDVSDGRHVILARKCEHKRSQLWRMNADGNLVHFDSSSRKDKKSSSLVLDIDDRYLDDGKQQFRLVLNFLNPQRTKTQTWYFDSNHLRCGLANYVVQLIDLNPRPGLPVILARKTGSQPYPLTCITRQKLRPGSGVLSVRLYSNGPTQVIEVSDAHQEQVEDPWLVIGRSHSNVLTTNDDDSSKVTSTEIVVSLASGVGISVINFIPEELLFVTLSSINFYANFDNVRNNIDLQIGSVQIDNQLYGSQVPVCLFSSPQASKSGSRRNNLEVRVNMERDKIYELLVFKTVQVDVCNLHLKLEDRLLLKLIQAVQKLHSTVEESEDMTSKVILDSRYIDARRKTNEKKYFFEDIVFHQGDLTMSLVVTGKLEDELVTLKKGLGIPLVNFESAVISFEPYQRHSVFEAVQMLLDHVLHYYKQTFISQAAVLLGSLDILGNPMGFIQDFSTGVQGLIKKGNVGGLFVNVAHGFSDSAAKMTSVIADGLWSASMGNKSQESRDSLRASRAGTSSSHFSAGLKGLGMGVIGGLTGLVTQPIEGITENGLPGLFTGIGKGLVGTVAKPVAGVLDLASGTAAAVRTTTESVVPVPLPVRMRRNCFEHGGVLGKYNKMASEGQEILLKFNEGILSEKFIVMEQIRPGGDKLKALLTSKGVYFVKSGPPSTENIFLHVEYARLLDTNYIHEGRYHAIEMFFNRQRHFNIHSEVYEDRTVVRCDSERIAVKVCQKLNYLKSLHEESLFAFHTLNR